MNKIAFNHQSSGQEQHLRAVPRGGSYVPAYWTQAAIAYTDSMDVSLIVFTSALPIKLD